MTVVRDYTGISYAAEGQEYFAWNGGYTAGTAVVVSYSFVETADLGTWEDNAYYANNGYASMTTAQRANVRDAMAVFAATAGIVFVEVASGTGMINVMRTSGSGYGGWADVAYSSGDTTGKGELLIDNTGNFDEGSYAFQTILHELGHAMGLEHPWEGDITLDDAVDNQTHTVMTYNNSFPYTSHLGSLDVDAMLAQYGEAQNWQASMVGQVLHLTGSAARDNIIGLELANQIDGLGGNDRIFGRGGDDTLLGGLGNDRLEGRGGSNDLTGGVGNDVLTSGGADDALYGGLGRDVLDGGFGADVMQGGAGKDILRSGVGQDSLSGGAGDDLLDGGVEVWYGGNDKRLLGEDGDDTLRGGFGADSLYGGDGNDRLVDQGNVDYYYTGDDQLYGGAGDDLLFGGLSGTYGNYLYGGAGDDRLHQGETDQSHLFGGAGSDSLYSGTGGGVISGDDGNDVFFCDVYSDVTGGRGADRLVVQTDGADIRLSFDDFRRGTDVIDLRPMNVRFADLTIHTGWVDIGQTEIHVGTHQVLTRDDFLF